MRLFFYYVLHTLKNQIRKIFKTWVAVLFIVCFAFGALAGGLGVFLDEAFPEETPDEKYEEVLPDEESPQMTPEETLRIVEAVAGAIALAILCVSILAADKSGNAIFLPADVPTLFASPLRPQAVLLFRLLMQSGTFFFIGFYFSFQIPTLAESGVPVLLILGVILAFALLMISAKLIQTLLYLLASVHPRVKKLLFPTTIAALLLIAVGLVAAIQLSEKEPLVALLDLLSSPASRLIPVWGWCKGAFMFVIEENLLGALILFGATLITDVLLALVIWHTRADFYEDAMQKSEETAAILDAAQSSSGVSVISTRKKDRSDRLRRDGFRHGAGASVYFFKAMYNRFRFAHLHVFTKTSETYLAVALLVSLITRFAAGSTSILPTALVLCAFVFFRSLGNPLSQDTQMDSFLLVPESAWKKTFFSLLGGSANCALDLLPALLVATLIVGADPFEVLAWLLFALTVELYATNAGVFVDLSIPVSIGKQVKAVIQLMFIYFGLLPDALILILGGLFFSLPIAAIAAAALNLALAGVFFAFSPMFLEYGRS